MNYRSLNETEQERFSLALARIAEIASGETGAAAFADFFQKEAEFLLAMNRLSDELKEGVWEHASLEQLQKRNEDLYAEVLPEHYTCSYGNPSYAVSVMGDFYGQYFSFLFTELRGAIVFAFENRPYDFLVIAELFLECYCLFEHEKVPHEELKSVLYSYVFDYAEEFIRERTRQMLDPEPDFARSIIMEADLSDPSYLYRFGEYIGENEKRMAAFLAKLPKEEIEAIARTWTEGYRIGFEIQNKPLHLKKTVNIRYRIGFERIVREAIRQFADMGLSPVFYRPAAHSINRRGHLRAGYYGAVPNPQMDADHKNDAAIYTDERLITAKLSHVRTAYEAFADLAGTHGGPAVMEVFGETPFTPEQTPEALRFNDDQQLQISRFYAESAQIVNRFIKGDERSFTIIAYPIPEIGTNFEEIFAETVKINNLDYKLYQTMHQKLIDALDQGSAVEVHGAKGNRTNLTIRLHALKDPQRQTNFENCVADVNIPVGEVFTSPVLSGTSGKLHVKRVYLGEFQYKDLEIELQDGMITDFTCRNFEDEEENRRYIEENILYHHKSIPIGEFAIGTNTTAYAAAAKYHIADKLPILIAEKMGPHFAFGDTCYSYQEDLPVLNPDGKEMIARENERSALRHSNPKEAYFGCHTDITLPYSELGTLDVVRKDGSRIRLLENGRFVLPGTELLNEPLDAMNQEEK